LKKSVRTAVLALENQIRIFTEQRTYPNQNAEAISRLDAAIARAERELADCRAKLKDEEQFQAEGGESSDK
jgi:hypothetical protein